MSDRDERIGIFGWVIFCIIFYNLFLADDDDDEKDKVNDSKTPIVAEETMPTTSSEPDTFTKDTNDINETLNDIEIKDQKDLKILPAKEKEEELKKEEDSKNKKYNTATLDNPYGKLENRY